MNIETFLYNENFYRKFCLSLAIIRLTPSNLTPKEYTKHLQNILRQRQIKQSIKYNEIQLKISSLQQTISTSLLISMKYFDLIEYYQNFLQNIFILSIDFNIEIQNIIIETIDRLFILLNNNIYRIKENRFKIQFKQILNTIFNFHMISNIQQHSIQHIRSFIDKLFIYMKQSTIMIHIQTLIEQIGMFLCTQKVSTL